MLEVHYNIITFDNIVISLSLSLSLWADYDLQATMVECCISALGDSSRRGNHAHRWFSDHNLITAFMNIHETTFEMVCYYI